MHELESQTFLSFCSGRNNYVIPINDVVYITESSALMMRTMPTNQVSLERVFDFNGEPLQLIMLSKVFGLDSRAEESDKLIALLSARKQDHINWMESLEHSLTNDVPFEKATDPHKCAFGQWYDSFEASDADLAEILEKFDIPHKRIHALAEELLVLASSSLEGREKALQRLDLERHVTLKSLLHLFAQAIGRLQDLAKPITIIVTNDSGQRFGIEVDMIGDVIEFQTSEWISSATISVMDSQCFDGFYQGHEDLYINFNLQALKQYL